MKNPSPDDISQRARQLWQDQGQPSGRDDEIWLEAERQLLAGDSETTPGTPGPDDANSTSESAGARGLADRIKAETAAESVVEYHISPPISEAEAIQAVVPKRSPAPGKKKR